MRRLLADLHIHSSLSPCASREMTPREIVRESLRRGLGMIAVCDHNSAGNVRAVLRAAGPELLVALPGIEITTAEEVHVLGLFPEEEAALAVSAILLERLPLCAAGPSPEQQLFGENGEPAGLEPRMLVASSGLELGATVDLIRERGGLAVASHVDRPSFSVLGQLGFMPPEVRFDAAEISAAGVQRGRVDRYRSLGLPLLSSSDSHCLEEIGAGAALLDVEEASFAELVLALRGEGGRRCRCA